VCLSLLLSQATSHLDRPISLEVPDDRSRRKEREPRARSPRRTSYRGSFTGESDRVSFDNLINARWRNDRREIMTVPIKASVPHYRRSRQKSRYNWVRISRGLPCRRGRRCINWTNEEGRCASLRFCHRHFRALLNLRATSGRFSSGMTPLNDSPIKRPDSPDHHPRHFDPFNRPIDSFRAAFPLSRSSAATPVAYQRSINLRARTFMRSSP